MLVSWFRFVRRYVSRGLLAGMVCALAAWLLGQPTLLRGIDEWLHDGAFQARGPRPSAAKIVLVGVDDVSLDQLGKPAAFLSPELAEVVAFLHQQGAAAIGIDLIVPESLERSAAFAGLLEADKLGRAIYEADNVVLAKRFIGNRESEDWLLPLTQWRFKSLTERARPTDLGFVDLIEDRDHYFRRQQLLGPEGDMHFALALYAVASRQEVRWQDGLWIGGERVPLDDQQCLRVNFVGPQGTFPLVPFHEMLSAAQKQGPSPVDVQGAIVILGGTGRSQQDYHATPYDSRFFGRLLNDDSGLMAGSELHANLIATLADRAYIRSLSGFATFVILLVVGAVLGDLFGRVNLEWGILIVLLQHLGWLALAVAAFRLFRLRFEMVDLLLLGTLLYGVVFGLRWRRLRRMLGMVQSESIARSLEAGATSLELRGQSRFVTVLFADIRQFTAFSEKHSPSEVVALLNAYFEAIVPLIEAHGGTLTTYMGDGIMVIFGAPDACPDHALHAVRAAVAMVGRVHERRSLWATLGYPEFRIGVGIHTGEVVVGMIGSPSRLAYTAIGDTVNAAARIESENKRIGSEILLSARTRDALPEAEHTRLGISAGHEPVFVKGKTQPLDIYRIDVPADIPLRDRPLSSTMLRG